MLICIYTYSSAADSVEASAAWQPSGLLTAPCADPTSLRPQPASPAAPFAYLSRTLSPLPLLVLDVLLQY